MALITERYADKICGVLGCFDRMLIFGTLPGICFAGGMTSLLFERKIRIFDYSKFAEPFRNRIRENAEQMAAQAGMEIEFIRKRNFRKEGKSIREMIVEVGRAAVAEVGWLDTLATARFAYVRQGKTSWVHQSSASWSEGPWAAPAECSMNAFGPKVRPCVSKMPLRTMIATSCSSTCGS